jgi:hypothetical protein
MYPPITYSLLKLYGACPEQLALFKKHFGVKNSVPLTKAVARKFGCVFQIHWAVGKFLTERDRKEYYKACTPYLRECCKADARLTDRFNEAGDYSGNSYEKYENARARNVSKCYKAEAEEFVRIYKRGLTSKNSQ